jgi:hypothetical protein
MNSENPNSSPPTENADGGLRWPWFLAIAGVLIVLIAIFLPRPNANSPTASASTNGPWSVTATLPGERSTRVPRGYSPGGPALTAKEIVAGKVIQFAKSRRKLVHAMARHLKVDVPDDVERFFAAVESGRWEEIDAAHNALLLPGEGLNQPRSAELHQIWRAIQETWGAAREAHNWPAQRLLDYGNAILDSLRPGMVYVGGTDPGCFIPTFLNETSEGERHITLTQNALADGTYLDYLNFLYADRFSTLTHDDSQRAFNEYIADAQRRLEHDQQFPNEPKRIRPGEDVRMIDGKVQISGQIAVMAINEKLFQTLMDKNPDASFAIEQSFPFESTYANATPLGPIMELGVRDEQNALTAERAAQSMDYWRATAHQLLADPETPDGSDPRKAYSKLVSEQAALLLNRNYSAPAEEAFKIANEICPSSPEAVFRYVQMLMGQNRIQDAVQVGENAVKAAPENQQFRDLLEQLRKMKKS